MSPSRTRGAPRRSDVLFWALPAIVELPVVGLLFAWSPQAADDAPLGVPGTLAALAVATVVMVAAAVASWRATPARPVSRAIPLLLVAVTPMLVLLTIGSAGSAAVILLLHSTLCAAVLAALTRRQAVPA